MKSVFFLLQRIFFFCIFFYYYSSSEIIFIFQNGIVPIKLSRLDCQQSIQLTVHALHLSIIWWQNPIVKLLHKMFPPFTKSRERELTFKQSSIETGSFLFFRIVLSTYKSSHDILEFSLLHSTLMYSTCCITTIRGLFVLFGLLWNSQVALICYNSRTNMRMIVTCK